MNKISSLFLFIFSILFLVGCDSANIEVGSRDGRAYFNCSSIAPEIYLIDGTENIKIEDETLFGILVDAIQDKPVTMHDDCECQPLHTLKIKDYKFVLHNHGILITQSTKGNVKHINYIGFVECDEKVMRDIFNIVESIKRVEHIEELILGAWQFHMCLIGDKEINIGDVLESEIVTVDTSELYVYKDSKGEFRWKDTQEAIRWTKLDDENIKLELLQSNLVENITFINCDQIRVSYNGFIIIYNRVNLKH